MRIGIGRISQETNTFSPMLTGLETLKVNGVLRGQEVLSRFTEWSLIPAFLEVLGDQELVGILSVHARPAGCLTGEAQSTVLDWFKEDLEKALPLDGLLLDMHGAFAGIRDPDVEGLVLQSARTIVGPDVLIGVVMDLHACITRRKIENADLLRGYHTHPHVDGAETARLVAEMLLLALKGRTRPVISAVKIPMITPAETQLSEEYPLKDLMELTSRQEEDDRVLSSSLFAVQPWMDVPEMGWTSVIVTDGDQELADRISRELAAAAWEVREAFIKPCPTYEEALEEAFASGERPIVISDFADLMTGGGTGDSTWYLKGLLDRNPQDPCYVTMVDPAAVQAMARAGVGTTLTLELGGKQDKVYSSPVKVNGEVVRILPPFPGREMPQDAGLVGVLKICNIYVVVLERLGPGSDPIIYSGAGLDPAQAKVMIAKSVVDFRDRYRGIARRFLQGEAPGLAPSNLKLLHWHNVPRPIFPLDQDMSWDSAEAIVYRSKQRR
jgi:microcystin degradation protein MlrC